MILNIFIPILILITPKYSTKIGILTMPLSPSVRKKMNISLDSPSKNSMYYGYSFFPTSYSKWIEKSGSEVVPLDYNNEKIYDVINTLDGLLLTGGSAQLWIDKKINIDDNYEKKNFNFSELSNYAKRISSLIKIIKEINKKRDFPIWGTCLGFEALLLLELEKDFEFDRVDNLKFNSNLNLGENSEFFDNIFEDNEKDIVEDSTKNSFFFNHSYGLLINSLDKIDNFDNKFKILATSKGKKPELGEFVAMVKSKDYPFYAVQFHPEKLEFEDIDNLNPTEENIQINDRFLNLFIDNIHKTKRSLDEKVEKEHEKLLNDYLKELEMENFNDVGPFREILLIKKNEKSKSKAPVLNEPKKNLTKSKSASEVSNEPKKILTKSTQVLNEPKKLLSDNQEKLFRKMDQENYYEPKESELAKTKTDIEENTKNLDNGHIVLDLINDPIKEKENEDNSNGVKLFGGFLGLFIVCIF